MSFWNFRSGYTIVAAMICSISSAFAATGTITIINKNTGTATASTIFTKSFQNICGTTSPTPAATLQPGQSQTFVSNCLGGASGGLRFTTSSGKECAFTWSMTKTVPPYNKYTPASKAESVGSSYAVCKISGYSNVDTGDKTHTLEMQ